jgi:hypothetical protein
MIKRLLIPFLIILLVTVSMPGAAPVHAGGQRWSAWMYNPDNGQLLLLTDLMGGRPETLTLPMPAGYNKYPNNVAISRDWHYMAYVVTNTSTGRRMLNVYDRNMARVAFSYPLPVTIGDSLDFVANEFVFNETSTALAFSYSLSEQGWEVKVFNLAAAAGIPTLRHDNSAVQVARIDSRFTLPVVQRFVGTDVALTVIRLATEGSDRYPNYIWNITSGQITPGSAYPSLGIDTLATTGETISAASDSRFPTCGEPCSMFIVSNVLNVYDPSRNALFPFFNTADLSLFSPVFIQNGERILVTGSGRGEGGENKAAVIERNGNLVGYMPSGMAVGNAIGWQDGFLYMPPVVNPTGSPTLVVVNTRNGLERGTIAWQGDPGAQQLHLIYTPGNQPGTGPFAAWRQLAPTSVQANPPSNPNPPASTGTLTVGRAATVNTTQGDKLNVRSGPGRTFSIVTKLDAGTRVTLLEGPRSADGLTWWRIRTPSGAEGWVIESIVDQGVVIQTLIPA